MTQVYTVRTESESGGRAGFPLVLLPPVFWSGGMQGSAPHQAVLAQAGGMQGWAPQLWQEEMFCHNYSSHPTVVHLLVLG